MAPVVVVVAGDQRDSRAGEILVVQGPALFHVDETDPLAVPAGEAPCVLGVDSRGSRILVALVHLTGIVDGGHRRFHRPAFGVSPHDAVPTGQFLGHLFRPDTVRYVDRHVRREVGRLEIRSTVGSIGRHPPNILRRHARDQGPHPSSRISLCQMAPALERVPRRVGSRWSDVVRQEDDDPAPVLTTRVVPGPRSISHSTASPPFHRRATSCCGRGRRPRLAAASALADGRATVTGSEHGRRRHPRISGLLVAVMWRCFDRRNGPDKYSGSDELSFILAMDSCGACPQPWSDR